jgi:hypothetical protein
VPDPPFIIVDRDSCYVDFTGISELWDAQTVASVAGTFDNGGVEWARHAKDGTEAFFGVGQLHPAAQRLGRFRTKRSIG